MVGMSCQTMVNSINWQGGKNVEQIVWNDLLSKKILALSFSKYLANMGLHWWRWRICLANAGDTGSIPAWGRSPGEGNGNPVFLPGKSYGQKAGRLQSLGLQRVGTQLSY